jgi:hypothetical protein
MTRSKGDWDREDAESEDREPECARSHERAGGDRERDRERDGERDRDLGRDSERAGDCCGLVARLRERDSSRRTGSADGGDDRSRPRANGGERGRAGCGDGDGVWVRSLAGGVEERDWDLTRACSAGPRPGSWSEAEPATSISASSPAPGWLRSSSSSSARYRERAGLRERRLAAVGVEGIGRSGGVEGAASESKGKTVFISSSIPRSASAPTAARVATRLPPELCATETPQPCSAAARATRDRRRALRRRVAGGLTTSLAPGWRPKAPAEASSAPPMLGRSRLRMDATLSASAPPSESPAGPAASCATASRPSNKAC